MCCYDWEKCLEYLLEFFDQYIVFSNFYVILIFVGAGYDQVNFI